MNFPAHANDMAQTSFILSDLAPGDQKSAAFDVSSVEVARVSSGNDPLFEVAYARLWEQFGPSDEIETRAVLGRRLAWDPAQPRDGLAKRYGLLLGGDRGGARGQRQWWSSGCGWGCGGRMRLGDIHSCVGTRPRA